VRRISGRHQISADGKHLVDGLAFGRPLLRRPADRPSVNIPPRKKRRVTYSEIEDDVELDEDAFLAIEEADADESDFESNNNQQLVLHADFDDDDDDSEEDDDFVPGEYESLDDGSDESEELDEVEESQEEGEPGEQNEPE